MKMLLLLRLPPNRVVAEGGQVEWLALFMIGRIAQVRRCCSSKSRELIGTNQSESIGGASRCIENF